MISLSRLLDRNLRNKNGLTQLRTLNSQTPAVENHDNMDEEG